MRTLPYQQVVDCVKRLYIDCAYDLGDDVLSALIAAAQAETNVGARDILTGLIDNARIAKRDRIPLCQDTGLPVVFVEPGGEVVIAPPTDDSRATLTDAVQQGITLATSEGFLRSSVVSEPLNTRKNTGGNTPAVIHTTIVSGDKLKITVMAKGGGCENKSAFAMFNPTQGKQAVSDWVVDVVKAAGANACPPFVIGVGLGGNFEYCCRLSKRALLRQIGSRHPDPFYAHMEDDLLLAVNSTGLGPAGLGGDTTSLAVFIETSGCHIASLPAAVNIECHSHRHKSAIL